MVSGVMFVNLIAANGVQSASSHVTCHQHAKLGGYLWRLSDATVPSSLCLCLCLQIPPGTTELFIILS